jgi:3-oxoacyl-[acyl-carrier protein] reductase
MGMEQLQNSLAGKVAVVTGASAGVGWHTAKLFAQQGAKVVVTARREERLKKLVAEIEAAGGEAAGFAGDASEEATALACVALALKRFGRLDILINNAGQGNYSSLMDTSVSRYDELMNSNMRSTFVFSRAAAPHLMAQRSGTIVIVSSVAGLNGFPNETVYCASKFAQIGFGQALDAELRGHGVQVTVMCPGGIRTEFALGRGRTEESIAAAHWMEPEEFAGSLLYTCLQPAHMRVVQMTVRHLGVQGK